MHLSHILLLIATCLLQIVLALDLSDKHLAKYVKLTNLQGLHEVKLEQTTPPSTKFTNWYVNIYDPTNNKGSNGQITDVENCPADSQICGIVSVELPGSKEALVTEVYSFSNKLNPSFSSNETEDSITVQLNGANWGSYTLDAEIKFICSAEGEEGKLELQDWNYSKVRFFIKSPNACISDKPSKGTPPDLNKPNNGSDDADDSKNWGFFTWIFILLVLFLAAYIIFTLWINNSNRVGGSSDIMNELLDSIVETLSKLPQFVKEIFNKFSNNGNRGGYSAV